MTKKLNKYILDFLSSWEFTQENLEEVNTLSIQLLKLLDFKNGHYFTLLPEDANFERIHNFKTGLILPQYPIQECIIKGKKSTFARIPDIEKEVSQLLFKETRLNKYLSYIFDDVKGRASDDWSNYSYDIHPMFYGQDVYFLLNEDNLSVTNIKRSLRKSLSFWHSLCVITTADFSNVERNLSLEKIQEVCQNVELVIIGAYDGEGYIFWEKNPTKENKGFFLN
jgi:hypothetical protein